MHQIVTTEKVQLAEDLAELELKQGAVGVVLASWHYPNTAYEVEFKTMGCPVRLLLLEPQVRPQWTGREAPM